MNKTDEQLASLIEQAKNTGTDIITFVQQQAPDVCDQIITGKIIDHAVGLLFSVLILGGAVAICVVSKKKDDDFTPIGYLLGGAFFVGGGFMLGVAMSTLLQCIFTPKAVLLQELSRLF
jgi:hypothetical protein